jgi:L-arabinokinase
VTAGRLRPSRTGRVLVFYVSGHAFGHASRSIEIINALLAADPDLEVVVRTSAARWLFDVSVRGRIEFHDLVCDTGVIQRDSLHLDEARTIEEAARFTEALGALARTEAAFLRQRGASVVAGDIPPLAFLAAHLAGLPAVAIGNFTWDWIYEAYREALVGWPELLAGIRRAYGHASLTLRLPMWGGIRAVELPHHRHAVRGAAFEADHG